MTFYRTSVPMIYGGDYRPDDEPPPEAVLEEKRIVEHQFRRPSPSRWSSSATGTSMRPPAAASQNTSRSLRARATGGSPRRSSQRSSTIGNRRSATVTDRSRTASMPVVPIAKARNIIDNWRILITIFWIAVVLKLDPDPVILYRSKANIGHGSSNRNTTVVSTIERTLKAVIMIIQAFRSVEILSIFNDLKSIEKRLEIKGTSSVIYVVTCAIVLASVFELLCDYPSTSELTRNYWAIIEGISRMCLLTIELQFCSLCVRIAKVYERLHADVRSSGTDIRPTGGPLHRTAGLSAAALEFGALSGVAVRANGAYTGQLSLAVGLSFSGTLVDVYLCCFHALSLAAPWTTDMIGGVRALNNLLRLSAVSGAAHYAFKQALRVYQEFGRIRTSSLETRNIDEIEMFFIRYDPNKLSFKLFGSLTLDLSLTVLFVDSVLRCSLILIQYNWMETAFKLN